MKNDREVDDELSAIAKASPEVKDFLKRILEIDPERRLSATEALNHPWLNKKYDNITNQTKEADHILEINTE